MLTEADKKRFVAWLRKTASDYDAITQQLDKLGHAAVAKVKRREAAAAMIVANMLESSQSFEVTGVEVQAREIGHDDKPALRGEE